eukprot:5563731-Amphidinium_carterae.1
MKIKQQAGSVESAFATTNTSGAAREWRTMSSHQLHQESRIFLIVSGVRSMMASYFLWISSSSRLEPEKI